MGHDVNVRPSRPCFSTIFSFHEGETRDGPAESETREKREGMSVLMSVEVLHL